MKANKYDTRQQFGDAIRKANIEAGRQWPSLETLSRIADACDSDIADLIVEAVGATGKTHQVLIARIQERDAEIRRLERIIQSAMGWLGKAEVSE